MKFLRRNDLVMLGIGIVIFAVLQVLITERIMSSFWQLNVIIIGINVIMAVSLNLINGYTGQFSLGHAGFMAVGAYVGVSFYTPALYEGVEKYDCIFVGKCMFGEPSETNQTAGENIQFQTPVTNGEFLADDSEAGQIKEVCTVDSEALARAWCDAVLSAT